METLSFIIADVPVMYISAVIIANLPVGVSSGAIHGLLLWLLLVPQLSIFLK